VSDYPGGFSVSFPVRFRQALWGLVGIVLLSVGQDAHALSSLEFQGLVRTVNTGGSITLSSPAALVVDPTGNLFIADTNHSRIVEVNAQGVASVLTISGLSPASLSSPSGIAIDGAGNLYIADTGNTRVVEVSPSGAGSIVSTGSVTLTAPHGVALDQSGDLYISDGTGGSSRIVEVTSGGAAAALTINVSSGAPSLSSPRGLAVDVSGKLYIADSSNNRVVTVAAGSTTGVVFSTGTLIPALSNPSSVAVDRVGNVLIADTGHNRIAEVDTAGVGTNLAKFLSAESLLLSAPLGVAVDPFGAVYIADTSNSRALIVDPGTDWDPESGAGYTSSVNKSAVGFGHITLGSSTPTSLILHFSVGSPVSGLGGVNVSTSGTQGLDFQIVSGENTTCSSSTESGTTCTVEVSFLPTAPGLRSGQLVLYDPDSNPVLTVPLYGFGDAPVAALAPNTASVIGTGGVALSIPFQIALDGAGKIYDANDGGNLLKIPAGGGSASVVSPTGYTFGAEVTGVALDGGGNLFISDHDNDRILVITPGGVVSVLSIAGLSPALSLPTSLAFDASGTLYIADYGSGRTVEVSSIKVTGSTSAGIGTVIGTGSYTISPEGNTGVAVDWMGNIYIPDGYLGSDPSRIIKVTSAGVVSLLTPSGITFNSPQGVGVDAMGNIYVVDGGNNRIVEITAAGVASVLKVSGLTAPATLSSPFGVTVDPSGNLYIADSGNNRILFVNVSGSALAFTNTSTGAASAAQTATVTNLGNQPLVFSTNPTYTTNFSANAADTNPCTSSTALLSGIACDVSVQFTPQSVGSLSAGITVTNNTLNVAGSTQQVSVSGTSYSSVDTTSTTLAISPTSVVDGQSATLTAVVSDTTTPATVPTGGVSFTDTVGTTVVSLNGGVAVPLVAGTATLQVTPTVVGRHTITANFVGSSPAPSVRVAPRRANPTFASSSGTATLTVTAIVPTLSFGPIAAQTYGNPPFAVSATSASSGAVTYTVVSGPATIAGSMVTLTGAGTVVLLASQAASGNYATATANASFTVEAAAGATMPTLTFAPIPTQMVGNAPFAVSATSASTGAVTYAVVSGPATIAGNIVTLTGAGTVILLANQAASGNYAAATATTSFIVAAAPVGFTLASSSGSGVETVLPGGAAAFRLTLAPVSGSTYPDALTLSATGLPAGATAAFSPATIPAGSGATAVTMTVQTVNQQTAQGDTPFLGGQMGSMALAFLLLPIAGIKPVRKGLRKLPGLPVVLAAAALALGAMVCLSGCSSNGFFNQAPKSYTVVVTATDAVTGAHSSTNVTLTVQ
jgi:DNA-binding beta-propeller fold protein YncE